MGHQESKKAYHVIVRRWTQDRQAVL